MGNDLEKILGDMCDGKKSKEKKKRKEGKKKQALTRIDSVSKKSATVCSTSGLCCSHRGARE
jgi:hypothetical protein